MCFIHVCDNMYARLSASMDCIYVCAQLYLYARACMHMDVHVCLSVYICMYVLFIYLFTYMYITSCSMTCALACLHRVCMHVFMDHDSLENVSADRPYTLGQDKLADMLFVIWIILNDPA